MYCKDYKGIYPNLILFHNMKELYGTLITQTTSHPQKKRCQSHFRQEIKAEIHAQHRRDWQPFSKRCQERKTAMIHGSALRLCDFRAPHNALRSTPVTVKDLSKHGLGGTEGYPNTSAAFMSFLLSLRILKWQKGGEEGAKTAGAWTRDEMLRAAFPTAPAPHGDDCSASAKSISSAFLQLLSCLRIRNYHWLTLYAVTGGDNSAVMSNRELACLPTEIIYKQTSALICIPNF